MTTTRRLTQSLALGLVVGVIGTTAGCASGGTYAPLSDSSLGLAYPTVHVQNNNWQDVRVYLMSDAGGPPSRIGIVGSMSSRTLRIRQPINGDARFLLKPLGTRASYVTNTVRIGHGEIMQLTVQNSLTLSHLILR